MMRTIWGMLLLSERQVMAREVKGRVRSRVMGKMERGQRVHHQIKGAEVLKAEELLEGIARNQRMRMRSVRAIVVQSGRG